MNLQFLLKKLYDSENFKKFIKANLGAFLCSGFFVIDKTGKETNKQHFDFYVPSINDKENFDVNSSGKSRVSDNEGDKLKRKGEMFTFKMESDVEKVPVEMFEEKIPEKILINYDFDFEYMEKMIVDEMEKQGIKAKIQKILLSLQKLDGRDFLVGTIFISALGMIKIHIDISERKIILFEKKSFFDMINVLKKK